MSIVSKAEYLNAINTINLYVSQMEKRLPKLNAIRKADATLGDLDISVRAYNALKKVINKIYPKVPAHMHNNIAVSSFNNMKASDFMNAHNMGKITLTELIEAFEKYGVEIKYNI